MLTIDFDTLTRRMMVVAEMASGGEIIPPNKNPSASVKPGINQVEINAIRQDVRITIGNAKLMMIRRHLQNSFHETCQAASYSNGGRKIKKTNSGSIEILENLEVKLSASPPSTSTIGYAMCSLSAIITNARIIRINKMYSITDDCTNGIVNKNTETPRKKPKVQGRIFFKPM